MQVARQRQETAEFKTQ